MPRYIVYYRVSTQKQGRSGLGLEAQQAMFAAFLIANPGEVLGEYTEVETGKSLKQSLSRPKLQGAIAHAKAAGATLIIAKLDRLARNVAFISALMESKLPFKCCDLPEADSFTMHILAAVAQREAEMISERTKAALDALKARGVKLGSARPGHWDGFTKTGESRQERRLAGLEAARESSRETRQHAMAERYEPLVPWIREMRHNDLTLQQIVDQLNLKGCQTTRGKPWNIATLHRVIARYLNLKPLEQLGDCNGNS